MRCKQDAGLPSWTEIGPIKRCWVSFKHTSASLWVSRTGSSMSSVCHGASLTEASYRHCFTNHIIQNEMKKKMKMPQSSLTLACGNPVPFSLVLTPTLLPLASCCFYSHTNHWKTPHSFLASLPPLPPLPVAWTLGSPNSVWGKQLLMFVCRLHPALPSLCSDDDDDDGDGGGGGGSQGANWSAAERNCCRVCNDSPHWCRVF